LKLLLAVVNNKCDVLVSLKRVKLNNELNQNKIIARLRKLHTELYIESYIFIR